MNNYKRSFGLITTVLLSAFSAHAANKPPRDKLHSAETEHVNAAEETVQLVYTSSAFGTRRNTIGAEAFGNARGGFDSKETTTPGGGLRAWGSPLERLTLGLEGERRLNDEFAPAASAWVRILGDRSEPFALGALARYKAEGFAELEGEVEMGVLGSYARRGLYADVNVILGTGFEESETDGEFLARVGYDVLSFLRVGGEGRGRYRLAGDAMLAGNRDWDAFVGPQLLAFNDNLFGALTFGPSTVGIAADVGWLAVLSAGGVAF